VPARLLLLVKTSDCRLGGRVVGVFARSGCLREEEDATEDGLGSNEEDWGERDEAEKSLARDVRWSAGSFAFIASAKARDMYSTSGTATGWMVVEEERERPGVGIALRRGFISSESLQVDSC
jgi:hypothetical protein